MKRANAAPTVPNANATTAKRMFGMSRGSHGTPRTHPVVSCSVLFKKGMAASTKPVNRTTTASAYQILCATTVPPNTVLLQGLCIFALL